MKHQMKKNIAYMLTVILMAGTLSVPGVTVEAAETQHNIGDGNIVISECESGCEGHVITGDSLEYTVSVSGSHDITLQNVYIDVSADSKCAFMIADDNTGTIRITLVGDNYIASGGPYAGIQKNGTGNVGMLEITGTGNLQATGGNYNGTISKGEAGGAGIGGDINEYGTSNIVISGGTITATGGATAAGIGSGSGGLASDIVINGGSVSAFGGKDDLGLYVGAAGIGGGYGGTSSNIVINGGSLYAKSEGVDSIEAVFGYNINGNSSTEGREPVLPTNAEGKIVRLLKIDNPDQKTVVIDGKECDPNVHHGTTGNVLYAYLTEDKHTVEVGDEVTDYVYDKGQEAFLQEVTADMFSFEAPATLNYDGTEKAATVNSDITEGLVTLKYYDDEGNELSFTPTDVGTYKVKADVAAAGDYASATGISAEDWSFSITPAELSVTGVTAESKVYDKKTTVGITYVSLEGIVNADDVSVDVEGLYGVLPSSEVGSYREVTLPSLTLKGTKAGNYTLTQPISPVSVTVRINKAPTAPNKPAETLNVSRSTETVGAIDIGSLYEGWDWSDSDKTKALEEGTPVDATAVYIAGDKDNYETVETVVSILRSGCEHEEAEEIIVSANAIPGEKEPTCTETGVGHTICLKCHATMRSVVEIPALGHTGGVATCEALAQCTRCENTYGEKDPNQHSGRTKVVGKTEATCISAGHTGNVCCQECGEIVSAGSATRAKGHKWNNGVVSPKPTAMKTGIKKYTCNVCGATKTEVLAALGAPAKGTIDIDDTGAAEYKVTKAGLKGGTVEYVAPKKKTASVVIPDTVTMDGIVYKVTSIASNAFKGNKILKKITIGKNVTKIGANAFNGCKKLKTITFKTTKLKTNTVGKNAFKGINAKATIKVPKKKLNAYKKILKKRGVGSKVKFKKA